MERSQSIANALMLREANWSLAALSGLHHTRELALQATKQTPGKPAHATPRVARRKIERSEYTGLMLALPCRAWPSNAWGQCRCPRCPRNPTMPMRPLLVLETAMGNEAHARIDRQSITQEY